MSFRPERAARSGGTEDKQMLPPDSTTEPAFGDLLGDQAVESREDDEAILSEKDTVPPPKLGRGSWV